MKRDWTIYYAIVSLIICIITICVMLYYIKLSGYYIGIFVDQYWDRIILLCGIFCFFVNETFKSALKKKEIEFSMNYSEVFKSINNYVEAFYNYRISMRDLPKEFLKHNFPANELDKVATMPLNKLKYCDFILSLYLENDLYSHYNNITEKSGHLNDRLHIILTGIMDEIEYQNIYNKEFYEFDNKVSKLLEKTFYETKKIIGNEKEHGWFINLFEKINWKQGKSIPSNKQEDKNIERISILVDTITTLQGALNEKDKAIKLLEEKTKRLEAELAMIKNERKIG